ncbi:type I-B CRISPR-associated protein Cas8b1/Cst1 [Maritalea sp. S77]|uniref:type I-B CRISPR-associated protein Cas8b1/Cst1 n=1 Tax=Maritalea sp. S77 TaxID=3415125 RepID=UPI003C79EC08
MGRYQGSCHCGTVRFEIESDLATVMKCDCSLCRKRNAVMVDVHKDHFTLISGEDSLGTYQWNMKIAKHHFCTKCGIYTFHRKRSLPDHYGVNLYCLDGVDFDSIEIEQAYGSQLSSVEK